MVSLVGAMVVYWVLMSNFLFNTGKFIYSKYTFFVDFHGYLVKRSRVLYPEKRLSISFNFSVTLHAKSSDNK